MSRVLQRGLVVAAAAGFLVVVFAAPASAHGSAPDTSNFHSEVTRVAGSSGTAAVPGLEWRVRGADALLEVRNDTGEELIVTGYEDEPYLRVGPDGVFENRNSPAVYLNNDRYAEVIVPQSADPEAEPDWQKVSDAPVWGWHDHRIHWMSPTLPPEVRAAPDVQQTVLEWEVPFTHAGRDLSVQGSLEWIPPVPAWPWVTGAALAMLLPVAAMLPARHRGQRATRIAVAVLALVVLADAGYTVGDVAATPATFWEHLAEVARTMLPALFAAAFCVSAWRGHAGADVAILAAAVFLAVGYGLTHLDDLSASGIVNLLPSTAVRAIVAANLAVLVPGAVAAALPRIRRQDPAAAPGAVG